MQGGHTSFEMPKCRITVLKRAINQDMIDEYLDDEYRSIGLCDCFRDGQEIVIEDYSVMPEGFLCFGLGRHTQRHLGGRGGANVPGIKLVPPSPDARIGSGRSNSSRKDTN
jgi:hypothetical protein